MTQTYTKPETSKIPELVETPKSKAPYFFTIESESREIFYEIHYNFNYHRWACSCPGATRGHECKHIRAVHRVLDERRAAKKAQACLEAAAIAAAALDEKPDEIESLKARVAQLEAQVAALQAKQKRGRPRKKVQSQVVAGEPVTTQAPITEEGDLLERVAKIELSPEELAQYSAMLGVPIAAGTKTKRARRSSKAERESAPLNGNRGFSLMR